MTRETLMDRPNRHPIANRRETLMLAAGTAGGMALSGCTTRPSGPEAYGATPSPRQQAWHRMEQNAFVHFTINTFTDREWGYGDEDPKLFNPTDFDADQIVAVAKSANLRGLIVTAKHHDGFCLWPSAFTEHSVKNSPYKDGKGDIVGELAEACKRAGLKFGVYLSPWDRNHPDYGRPAYLVYFRNQLRELLTRYGPIFEVWFDGANGGDGYYGGAREVRKIDAVPYYDWPSIISYVHALQPEACTFDPKGADLRWVGNEEGEAGDPCWATMDDGPFTPEKGNSGVRGGAVWWPAEADVSTRHGWFWHPHEDGESRTAANLMKIYFDTVGRSTVLLLNFSPDTRGRITDEDADKARRFGDAVRAMYRVDHAAATRVTASSVARDGARYAGANVLDGRADSFWMADEAARTPTLTLVLAGAKTFDVVRLAEHLPLGLRVDRFAIDIAGTDGAWRTIIDKRGIGAQRLIRLPAPVTASQLRLRIVAAAAAPAITQVALYRQPVLLDPPAILRDAQGMVTLVADTPGQSLAYTLDGAVPTARSARYTAPFALPDGGTVRAIAIDAASGRASEAGSRSFDLRKSDWRIVDASAPEAERLIDENNRTDWISPVTEDAPAHVTIDFGRSITLRGFVLKPAWHAPQGAGDPSRWSVRVGDAADLAGAAIETGEFSNIAANQAPQRLSFGQSRSGRYLRIDFPRTAGGEVRLAIAELGVITR
jgi:alpha-L-fucosidase